GPERAAHVFNLYAGDLTDQPVAGQTRNSAHEEPVLPVRTQTKDRVVSFIEFVQQHGDIGGIVLQVPVHGDENIPARPVDARLQRRRLAEVPAKTYHFQVRIDRSQTLEDLVRPVAAAVVDDDYFVGE